MAITVRHLGLACTLLFILPGSFGQGPRKPERFKMPTLYVKPDDRIFPHPAWVTTQWIDKADAPFQAAENESKPFRTGYVRDPSGKWPAKARKAHEEWRIDCQDPVKLHRACVYFDVAMAVDQTFGSAREDERRRAELRIGWDTLRNPPRSHLFVRRGYGWNAGDGHRHLFGNLARELLKRNPVDRYVAHSAIGEMNDESRAKDGKLEQLLIDTFERIHKTPTWSFLDYTGLAACHENRAFRTFKRSDLQRAIEYGELALRGAPEGYDATWLAKARDRLVGRMKYMKFD